MNLLQTINQKLRLETNRALGYDIVQTRNQATLRTHLMKFFEVYPVDTVIDVGANVGQFGDLVREIGYEGHIYSFEPVEHVYDQLASKAAQDGRWSAYKLALGSESGKTKINVFRNSVLSSILPLNETGRNFDRMGFSHEEETNVMTLDDFISENISQISHIFLKMDTQGYDLEVFKGARNSAKKFYGLQSELSLMPIYEGMPTYSEALSVYENAGFRVSGIYGVSRKEDLSLLEVDCVFVHEDFFVHA